MNCYSFLARLLGVSVLGLGIAGCTSPSGEGPASPSPWPPLVLTAPAGPCGVQTATAPDEGADHVPTCSAVTYHTMPPTSGNHYPLWPVFRTYTRPIPWGFLVHDLEHGAIVISYNCPTGCADELAAAKALIDNVPDKDGCPRAPVVMVPEPTLDVKFAASAWRHLLRANCFDSEAISQFIMENQNHGP